MGSEEDDLRKTKILEVSCRLFAQHGYKKTTIADIAGAARIGKATIYKYFANKEAVFVAFMDSVSSDLLQKLQEAISAALRPEDQIRAWSATLIGLMKEHLTEFRQLSDEDLIEMLPMAQRSRVKNERKQIALLEKVIANATQDGVFHVKDPHGAAAALSLAIRGIDPIHSRSSDSHDLEKVAIEMVELFIKGLKSP